MGDKNTINKEQLPEKPKLTQTKIIKEHQTSKDKKKKFKIIVKEKSVKNGLLSTFRKTSYLILFLAFVLFVINMIVMIYLMREINKISITKLQTMEKSFIVDYEINATITAYIQQGKAQVIYDFYNQFINNYDIVYYIINAVLEKEIPIHKFIALMQYESGFNPNAINTKNNNGSTDIGLMQLNSVTYSAIIKEKGINYLKQINNNINYSAQHLANDYKKYKDWYLTIMAYNCGNPLNGINAITIQHQISILKNERELDILFNNTF